MGHEKDPSLQSQKPLSLLRLLVNAIFSFLSSSSRNLHQKSNETNKPHNSTNEVTQRREIFTKTPIRVVIDSVPEPKPPTDAERAENEQKRKYNKLKTCLEIAATLIGLGLLGINILLWYSTKKAADSADKSIKLAYRPRLLLIGIDARFKTSPTGIREPALDKGRLTVQIILPNNGPFAARNVRFFRYSNISPRAQIQKGVYEELFGEPKAIPPKVENYNSGLVIVGTKTVTDDEIRQLQNGTLWAIFSILVQYDDDFGITHHTEYCDLFTSQPDDNDICPWPIQND